MDIEALKYTIKDLTVRAYTLGTVHGTSQTEAELAEWRLIHDEAEEEIAKILASLPTEEERKYWLDRLERKAPKRNTELHGDDYESARAKVESFIPTRPKQTERDED